MAEGQPQTISVEMGLSKVVGSKVHSAYRRVVARVVDYEGRQVVQINPSQMRAVIKELQGALRRQARVRKGAGE